MEAIQAALPDWLAGAVPIGIGAGLRQGEASGLTVDRVDFLRRTLRVDRQLLCRQVPEPVLAPPKTAGSHRRSRSPPSSSIPWPTTCAGTRPGRATSCCAPLPASRWTPTASANSGRRARRQAGVPGLGYHSLRHTFASTLLSRGVSVKAVGDWLGHANPAITLST
ncbi:MAG: site-specific integrase [Acidimicrobiales bacterium]